MVIAEGINFPSIAFQTRACREKKSCSFLKNTKTSFKSTIDCGKTICLSLVKNTRLDENRQNWLSLKLRSICFFNNGYEDTIFSIKWRSKVFQNTFFQIFKVFVNMKHLTIISGGWAKYLDLPMVSRSIISQCRKARKIIADLRDR